MSASPLPQWKDGHPAADVLIADWLSGWLLSPPVPPTTGSHISVIELTATTVVCRLFPCFCYAAMDKPRRPRHTRPHASGAEVAHSLSWLNEACLLADAVGYGPPPENDCQGGL